MNNDKRRGKHRIIDREGAPEKHIYKSVLFNAYKVARAGAQIWANRVSEPPEASDIDSVAKNYQTSEATSMAQKPMLAYTEGTGSERADTGSTAAFQAEKDVSNSGDSADTKLYNLFEYFVKNKSHK